MPALVAGLCLLLTVAALAVIRHSESRLRHEAMALRANAIVSELERRIAAYTALLNSGAAFFEIDGNVNNDEFRRFFGALDLETTYRGSEGIGWSARMLPERERDLITHMTTSRPGAQIWPVPAGVTPRHAIIFLEPMSPRNRAAIGFNMMSEPIRRQAMRRAARTGVVTASAPVTMVPDRADDKTTGFLMYAPVYGIRPENVPERDRARALRGFIYSPFSVVDFVTSTIDMKYLGSDQLKITDNDTPGNPVLFESAHEAHRGAAVSVDAKIADRHWTVNLSRPVDGLALSPLSLTLLVLGSLISLLAGFATYMIVRSLRLVDANLSAIRAQEAIRDVLTKELTHRVKNAVATVLSLASLTRRNATSLDDFTERFTGRLRALSATHDALTGTEWREAELKAIVAAELAPFLMDDDGRVVTGGPDVLVAPNVAVSVGLALHELATNSAKYGALSVGEGTVNLSWTQGPDASRVDMEWIESGGPPVAAPTRRGFGSDLIERMVSRDLKTQVTLEYLPDGVRCRIAIPIIGHAPG